MEGRPWLFDNHLLVLKQLDGFTQPLATHFDTEIFWLQFYHLPILCMNWHYGNLIGESIGRELEVDVHTNDTRWGPFLRVWVEISLSISFTRGWFLNINGEKQWIPIKFEKLLKYASSIEK